MIFDASTLPKTAPTSVEEVLSFADSLFASSGFDGASVSLISAPTGGVGVSGAAFCVSVPIAELEALARRAAEAAAEEQGIQVSRLELALRQEAPERLGMLIEADAKAFLGKVTVRVTGSLVLQQEQGTLHFEGLQMDAGSGMFAGIAGAVLRPKLARLGEKVIDLRQIEGFGLQVSNIRATAQQLELSFLVV
jgi:hypothetical protein